MLTSALRYSVAYPIPYPPLCATYPVYKFDQLERPLPVFHRIPPCLQAPAQLPQYAKLPAVKVPCSRTIVKGTLARKEICGGEAGSWPAPGKGGQLAVRNQPYGYLLAETFNSQSKNHHLGTALSLTVLGLYIIP